MARSVQDPAHKAPRILATLFASTPLPPTRSTAPHHHHEVRKVQRPPRDGMLCGRKDTPLRSIGDPASGGARLAPPASQGRKGTGENAMTEEPSAAVTMRPADPRATLAVAAAGTLLVLVTFTTPLTTL